MRSLLWQSDAWKEHTEIQSDKALLKRVNNLIKDVCGMAIMHLVVRWMIISGSGPNRFTVEPHLSALRHR